MYKYETHLHTSVSSACAKVRGSEYLEKYMELGYDGVFVTDHFYLGNTCVPCELPWTDWVERYSAAYYETLEAGKRLGIKVFFGWESTYGSGEDFLIYGLGPDWLKAHPEIIDCDQAEQYELVHASGGAVVQAHPFRERWYMNEIRLHPCHCDAYEAINGGNLPYMDCNAQRFLEKYGLPRVCGSDIHSLEAFENNAVIPLYTETPLESAEDYARLILSGGPFVLADREDRKAPGIRQPELEIFVHDSENMEHKL